MMGKNKDGWVDDIYQEHDPSDTRSNSVLQRTGYDYDRSQSTRLERDASGLLSGVDCQFLDKDPVDHEIIYPVDRALYDPELDANWIELTVSSCALFPQRSPKRNYIYQYTLRIWDCNKTSEAAATGSLGQLLFDKDSAVSSKPVNVKSSVASNITTGSASSYNGDNKFEGVEQFQWYEFDDP